MKSKNVLNGDFVKNVILDNYKTYSFAYLFCSIVATIGVLLIYPFIGLADGLTRWKLAIEIIEHGEIVTTTLLSPVIPYIQAITYKLSNSYAFYTYIQAFWFYLAIFVLIKSILNDKKVNIFNTEFNLWQIVSVCIILYPSVFVFPLLLTDSSPVFILIIFIFVILNDYILHNKKISKIKLILTSILIALCIGIRINSIVLFLILIMYLIIINIIRKHFNFSNLLSVLLGIILGLVIPFIALPQHYNASTLGMLWELIGVAHVSGNKELICELGKYGDIDEALNRYGDPFCNYIIWDDNPPYKVFDISGKYSKEITKLYVKQIFKTPKTFIKNKIHFAENTMGIKHRLITSVRGVAQSYEKRTKACGAISNARQKEIRWLFRITTDGIALISLRPFYEIMLSFLLAMFAGKKDIYIRKKMYYWIVIATAYYLSFLINTQAHEFRYFAPSFYILFIIIICCLILIFKQVYSASLMQKSVKLPQKNNKQSI